MHIEHEFQMRDPAQTCTNCTLRFNIIFFSKYIFNIFSEEFLLLYKFSVTKCFFCILVYTQNNTKQLYHHTLLSAYTSKSVNQQINN